LLQVPMISSPVFVMSYIFRSMTSSGMPSSISIVLTQPTSGH
jgi:hypothetical protein